MRSATKRIGGPVLGAILAATLTAGVPRASAWEYTLDGLCALEGAGECADAANSVVVDSAGDIIAGGSIGVNPYISDGLVVKLSGQLGVPSVLWATRFTSDYPTPANWVNQVVLDGEGNVLAAGLGGGLDADFNPSSYLLVAELNGATGEILWEQHIRFSPYDFDAEVLGLALDPAGNVIAAGRADPEGDWTENLAVVKLNGADGTVLWHVTGPNGGQAESVAVDHANNVVVAGRLAAPAVAKYDGSTGAQLWVAAYTGGNSLSASFHSVAVDASDNVVAAGNVQEAGFIAPWDFHVTKLDTSGTDLWNFDYSSPGELGGAQALILDSAGNVFATGEVKSTNPADTTGDMATFKLAADTGAVLWQSIIDGGALGKDIGNAIALDPSGNPIVGGMLTTTRDTMGIVKLDDAAAGTEAWRTVVDGAGADLAGVQEAKAIAVDPRGDVVAAGTLKPVTGNYQDFAVVKLNGDGTDFVQLCGNGVIEGSETCDDGNAAASDGCSETCQTEAGFLCLGEPSNCVVPVGVAPKKLLVVDKLAASGSAKTTFTAKDPNVSKGTGTDPDAISATFTAAYANGAARGGFVMPAGAWLRNMDKVAKYVNKTAPAGPTQVKLALIRPGSMLSLTAKGIGDTPFDILTAGDQTGTDVNIAYCVTNGGQTFCHCSVNQNCVFTKVAKDTGAKLVCKGGVADPTCAALVP